jgi:molecular chaperone GrpE
MPSSRASEEQQQHEQVADRQEQAPEAPERDLNAQLEQMEDRFKRAAADLDNYRKRAARELDRLVHERGDAMLREWLEVVDGLDRAVRQQPDNPLYEGLRAVLDQVEAILERQGVRRLGEAGEPFDPNRHEAIEVRETGEAPDRTVLEVVRSGFARGDRILRPAHVVVARAPQQQQQS